MPIPGLPQGPRSLVYKRIVDQLKTDPILSTVVKTWFVWTENPKYGLLGQTEPEMPALKLTPQLGPGAWYSPDAQAGDLNIAVELGVNTYHAGDCLDFQDAIERAVYPFNDRSKQLGFEQQMRNVGCETGQITFTQPASIQQIDNAAGLMVCLGVMSVRIIRAFNP